MIAIMPVLHAVLAAVLSLGCLQGSEPTNVQMPPIMFPRPLHPPPSPYKMMSIMAYTVDLNMQLLKTIVRHRFHTTCAYLFFGPHPLPPTPTPDFEILDSTL